MNKRFLAVTRIFALVLFVAMMFSLVACGGGSDDSNKATFTAYTGPYSEVNGALAGVDDLGRELLYDDQTKDLNDKKVGIFYFLWQGEHGTAGPYDNYKIATETPEALESEKNWIKSGGGAVGAHHFWGEPLFGYYKSSDQWVMRKHVQMLTDAGVDFIVFDATNAYPYTERVKQLIEVWYEYLEMGYDVPKLAFYTNTNSGNTMKTIYKGLYANNRFNEQYPRLNELWYYWDGKPMIVGVEAQASDELKEYFTIKESTWPNAGSTDNGFPWMEFDKTLTSHGRLLTDEAVYGVDGRKEVCNVSIAQHSATCTMSYTAWYGANDRTRAWHDGANETSEDAILWGYNFSEQWEWALQQDTEMIFITGWNEWVAQRQPVGDKNRPIVFVDCADPNTSRDAEPMRGLYGDNYYMQVCYYVSQYKGAANRVNVGESQTIDINGDFSQWDNATITAKYLDYKNDTVDRDAKGFGKLVYTNTTGRNDIVNMKVARDDKNLYFYVDTAADLTAPEGETWMTLFIDSSSNETAKWYGYDFKIDPASGKVYKCNGDWSWTEVGTAEVKYAGNKLMLSVARETVGVGAGVDIQFKWADNYQMNEEGTYDIWSFYCDGDAAPYGRLNYVFSEVAHEAPKAE